MPIPTSLILALDLGTSSLKAGVFDLTGHCVALVNQEILIIPEGQLFIEFDGQNYWQAAVDAIRQVTKTIPGGTESIKAISISSHGETLFCLDQNGNLTRPAILTLDDRAKEEASSLLNAFPEQEIYQITGQPDVLPIWPAAKIAWIKSHEPAIYSRTKYFLLPQGFLLYRLTGQAVDDPSVLITTLLLDVRSKKWSPGLLKWLDLTPANLARIEMPGSFLGSISYEAIRLTSLHPGTSVVVGALDQVCAAIAAGNLQTGTVCESTGSVLALTVTASEPGWNGLPVYPHALPGLFYLLPWHATGGLALKWFRDRFTSGSGITQEKTIDFSTLVEEIDKIPAGSEGLVMLPHLEGAQFPESVPGMRGVFFGFGLQHGQAHFVRAILESIAFLIRRDIEILRESGIDIQEAISLGGGAKSDQWLQIKADVNGIPFRTLETEEAALLGAAILASIGAGYFTNIQTAVEKMSRPGKRFEPRPDQHRAYQACYDLYLKLHQRLLDVRG